MCRKIHLLFPGLQKAYREHRKPKQKHHYPSCTALTGAVRNKAEAKNTKLKTPMQSTSTCPSMLYAYASSHGVT